MHDLFVTNRNGAFHDNLYILIYSNSANSRIKMTNVLPACERTCRFITSLVLFTLQQTMLSAHYGRIICSVPIITETLLLAFSSPFPTLTLKTKIFSKLVKWVLRMGCG